jgi:hypothetical protein
MGFINQLITGGHHPAGICRYLQVCPILGHARSISVPVSSFRLAGNFHHLLIPHLLVGVSFPSKHKPVTKAKLSTVMAALPAHLPPAQIPTNL